MKTFLCAIVVVVVVYALFAPGLPSEDKPDIQTYPNFAQARSTLGLFDRARFDWQIVHATWVTKRVLGCKVAHVTVGDVSCTYWADPLTGRWHVAEKPASGAGS